jgi:hypothetical protein
MKVAQTLVAKGLVMSVRGRTGGLKLARDPHETRKCPGRRASSNQLSKAGGHSALVASFQSGRSKVKEAADWPRARLLSSSRFNHAHQELHRLKPIHRAIPDRNVIEKYRAATASIGAGQPRQSKVLILGTPGGRRSRCRTISFTSSTADTGFVLSQRREMPEQGDEYDRLLLQQTDSRIGSPGALQTDELGQQS